MRVALARLALSLSLLAGAALDAAAQGQLRVYNWNDYVAPEALKRHRIREQAAVSLPGRKSPAWVYLHGLKSPLSSTALRALRKGTAKA